MTLRFAIPSKGALYDATLAFLESCGLTVSRPNPRRYTAGIRALPEVEVLLHRPADIVEKIAEGEINVGISGLDLVEELRGDREDPLVLYDDLGFGRCELVVAVPEAWIDVSSWYDLADLSVELHAQGRPLRIATKYPALIRRFCYAHGINYFRLIDSQGATEAAPGLGYADIVADITETGTTLRDNQLKIVGEPILRSQACLIGSCRSLRGNVARLAAVKVILELVEARRRARLYAQLTVTVPGDSVEDVARRIMAWPELADLRALTVMPAPVVAPAGGTAGCWYTATVVVPQDQVLGLVEHLRALGASGMTIIPTQYVFESSSAAYERLLAELERDR